MFENVILSKSKIWETKKNNSGVDLYIYKSQHLLAVWTGQNNLQR